MEQTTPDPRPDGAAARDLGSIADELIREGEPCSDSRPS